MGEVTLVAGIGRAVSDAGGVRNGQTWRGSGRDYRLPLACGASGAGACPSMGRRRCGVRT
ncbi:hypothetical protein GSI01S_33_00020 [Gordonia sihwensis NBRC 108236]|uniref:Uncharacterized protein n=1 Tax=Gordonia sihwensis NBRC 108236 TaxID=1223544 RepID=L7LNL0_9ACTN|nr:hypothetical protein GSI01S_33_00020 [Gordonia sihwensis NBRC 108236]